MVFRTKKTQISNELLMLLGIVLIIFLGLYSYQLYLERANNSIYYQLKMQRECNLVADKIALVMQMGNGFQENYEFTKYKLRFYPRTLMVVQIKTDKNGIKTETGVSAVCKMPLIAYAESTDNNFDVTDFDKTDQITITNELNKIKIE